MSVFEGMSEGIGYREWGVVRLRSDAKGRDACPHASAEPRANVIKCGNTGGESKGDLMSFSESRDPSARKLAQDDNGRQALRVGVSFSEWVKSSQRVEAKGRDVCPHASAEPRANVISSEPASREISRCAGKDQVAKRSANTSGESSGNLSGIRESRDPSTRKLAQDDNAFGTRLLRFGGWRFPFIRAPKAVASYRTPKSLLERSAA